MAVSACWKGSAARIQAAVLATLASFVAGLAVATPAGATVTASQVTTPANLTYLTAIYDTQNSPNSSNSVTIAGTSNGVSGDKVDLRCYYGTGYETVATAIDASGSFSVSVPASRFAVNNPLPTCVLRAVPNGTAPAAPPGSLSPFGGPTVLAGKRQTYKVGGTGPNKDLTYDFDINRAQLTGFMRYASLGNCGLRQSAVFDPASLAVSSDALFYCDDFLSSQNGGTLPGTITGDANHLSATRSELRVDGVDAYVPGNAGYLFSGAGNRGGFPPLSFSDSVDPATGNLTITESEQPVFCDPAPATYPATSTSCLSFTPAPVRFTRTIVQNHDGRVASLLDTWASTDGAAHQLDLQLENDIFGAAHDTALQFPWVSGAFQTHVVGDTVPGAPGQPASIYLKESLAAPDGDLNHPQGAITFSTAPDSAKVISDEGSPDNQIWIGLLLNYARTVPASGSLALGFTYSDASLASEVRGDAAAAEAAFRPTVSIGSPANGATLSQSPATVSGTASDANGIASLTVNGQNVPVAANGSWGASVKVTPGANTITATATNVYGTAAQAKTTVTYTPPPPPPSPPPAPAVTKFVLAGAPTGSKTGVSFSLSCQAAPGTTCSGVAELSTLEKMLGQRVTAVSAKRPKRHSQRVVVGSMQLSLSTGETKKLEVPLNSTGRRLLARFKRLPATLKISLMNTKPPTVLTSTTTIEVQKKTTRERRHK